MDDKPEFSSDPYADVSVPEDKAVAQVVATVSATDPQGQTLVYSLSGGDGKFSINSSTGEISIAQALDYETKQEHEVDLKVTDPDGNEDTSKIKFVVTDVGDVPVVSPNPVSVTLAESVGNGTAVASFSATDPQGQSVTWSLDGHDNKFAISTSGNVTVSDKLDYEQETQYTITVKATDPDGNVGEATLNVTLTDVADNPVLDPISDQEVLETASHVSPGELVTTASATDPNGQTITYTLSGGDGKFHIPDSSNGEIRVKAQLDWKENKTHELTVTATDPDGNYDTETFTVNVKKVNDAPQFSQGSYSFTLGEGSKKETYVGRTPATDPDGDDLTYHITGDDSGGLFEYDGNRLELAKDAPINDTATYTLTVEVRDNGTPVLDHTATVIVNMKPLVAVTGDFRGVEATGDSISLEFKRYSHDLSDELSVTYNVSYGDGAEEDDFQNPEALVDAGATSRTIVFESGVSSITVNLLPAMDTDNEGVEQIDVTLQPSSEYTLPRSSQDLKGKKKKSISQVGFKKAPLLIVDDVTLFGPNNTDANLADNNSLGIHWNDISQGSIGDCYCLAAVGSMTVELAQTLHDKFIDNGDGTYTLYFFPEIGQAAVPITVPLEMIYGSDQANITGDTDDDGKYEIWPMIFENAYREFVEVHLNESFDGGKSDDVWEHLFQTPHHAVSPSGYSDSDLKDLIVDELSSTGLVVLRPKGNDGELTNGGKLYGSHAYVVYEYNDNGTATVDDDTILIFNPWGIGDNNENILLTLTFDELKSEIDLIRIPE